VIDLAVRARSADAKEKRLQKVGRRDVAQSGQRVAGLGGLAFHPPVPVRRKLHHRLQAGRRHPRLVVDPEQHHRGCGDRVVRTEGAHQAIDHRRALQVRLRVEGHENKVIVERRHLADALDMLLRRHRRRFAGKRPVGECKAQAVVVDRERRRHQADYAAIGQALVKACPQPDIGRAPDACRRVAQA
jgi:hypothetical protein